MDSWMPSGLASNAFSFGAAAESAALAVAAASIEARHDVKNVVLIVVEQSFGLSFAVSLTQSSMRRLRHDLRLLGGLWRVVNHCVGVFDTRAVSASLLFEDAHERVVMFFVFPI